MSRPPCCDYAYGSIAPHPFDGKEFFFHWADAQETLFLASWRRHREEGTAVKQAESHAEKIDPAFGQHPFALRFVPS